MGNTNYKINKVTQLPHEELSGWLCNRAMAFYVHGKVTTFAVF